MADIFENPMGLMGFEFIEFASPTPNALEPIFAMMGFTKVATHRSKDVDLYRQGEINLILKRPDVIKKMGDMGVLLTETTPEQFGQILARDADKYGKLIKELGITAE
ncbi:4-hydroxyphenylpyruvate dioxygenase [compost metagenome]